MGNASQLVHCLRASTFLVVSVLAVPLRKNFVLSGGERQFPLLLWSNLLKVFFVFLTLFPPSKWAQNPPPPKKNSLLNLAPIWALVIDPEVGRTGCVLDQLGDFCARGAHFAGIPHQQVSSATDALHRGQFLERFASAFANARELRCHFLGEIWNFHKFWALVNASKKLVPVQVDLQWQVSPA